MKARERPLGNEARLMVMRAVLPPESLPVGQELPAGAILASLTVAHGVSRTRAAGALSELRSLGLVSRFGERYSPTAKGARCLAMELLRRTDAEDLTHRDLPHPNATYEEHLCHVERLLDAAGELEARHNERGAILRWPAVATHPAGNLKPRCAALHCASLIGWAA